jgi:hypothetical protein
MVKKMLARSMLEGGHRAVTPPDNSDLTVSNNLVIEGYRKI